MEHVLFLEGKQLGKDLLNCLECRLGVRNPRLSAITSRNVFELLVSKSFMVYLSLISGPVLVHLMQLRVGQYVMLKLGGNACLYSRLPVMYRNISVAPRRGTLMHCLQYVDSRNSMSRELCRLRVSRKLVITLSRTFFVLSRTFFCVVATFLVLSRTFFAVS